MGASVVAYVPHDYADLHVLGAAQENIRSQRCKVAVHRPHALPKIRIFPGSSSFTGRQSVDCLMYATPQPNLMHARWVLDMRQRGPLKLTGAATGAWHPVMELRGRSCGGGAGERHFALGPFSACFGKWGPVSSFRRDTWSGDTGGRSFSVNKPHFSLLPRPTNWMEVLASRLEHGQSRSFRQPRSGTPVPRLLFSHIYKAARHGRGGSTQPLSHQSST